MAADNTEYPTMEAALAAGRIGRPISRSAIVTREVAVRLPMKYGDCQMVAYTGTADKKEHVALVFGNVEHAENVLVRLHSECFTGDIFGSQRCDCGEQLDRSLAMVSRAGTGVVLYLRQEGRGIGLLAKLRAYNLQDEGYDTVDANVMLGHRADEREYDVAAHMLHDLGIKSVKLITNNPLKIEGLARHGVDVASRVQLQPRIVSTNNASYLATKIMRMGHAMDLPDAALRPEEEKQDERRRPTASAPATQAGAGARTAYPPLFSRL